MTGKELEEREAEERALLAEYEKRGKVQRTPPTTQTSIRYFVTPVSSGSKEQNLSPQFSASMPGTGPASGNELKPKKWQWTLSSR